MGLDMYLYRKLYCKNWSHMKPEEKHSVLVKKAGKKRTDIKPERISEVTEEVMYWRKANAIHKWFVDNVQGGIDKCQETNVSREQLAELLAVCKKVLNNSKLVAGKINNGYGMRLVDGKSVKEVYVEDGKVIADTETAQEFLPTAEGFFFGSTDYNEWYYNDVKETADCLEKLLAEDDGKDYHVSYSYQSSW